jgi:hypothetical protein
MLEGALLSSKSQQPLYKFLEGSFFAHISFIDQTASNGGLARISSFHDDNVEMHHFLFDLVVLFTT